MRIVFLNIWGARMYRELLNYIHATSTDVDLFLLTEVNQADIRRAGSHQVPDPIFCDGGRGVYCLNSFEMIEWQLTDQFTGVFSSERRYSVSNARDDSQLSVAVGCAAFYRTSLAVRFVFSDFINSRRNIDAPDGTRPRVMQSLVIDEDTGSYLIAHFHGLWTKSEKVDTPSRDEQTKRILTTLNERREESDVDHVILGGDMNFDRDNKALKQLESSTVFGKRGARNLITERQITSTRTPKYRRYNKDGYTQYADWVLTSSEIEVTEFSAPTEPVVSDHRPLVLTL